MYLLTTIFSMPNNSRYNAVGILKTITKKNREKLNKGTIIKQIVIFIFK